MTNKQTETIRRKNLGIYITQEKFFFFFPFDDNLRLRVCIPSFFIVNGRFTCLDLRKKNRKNFVKNFTEFKNLEKEKNSSGSE